MPKQQTPEQSFEQELEPSFEGLQELVDIFMEHAETDAKTSLSRAEIFAYIESTFADLKAELDEDSQWKRNNGGHILIEANKKKSTLKGELDPGFKITSAEELEKLRTRIRRLANSLKRTFMKGAVSARKKQKRPVLEKFETTLNAKINKVCKDIASKVVWLENGKHLVVETTETHEIQNVKDISTLIEGMVANISQAEPEKLFEQAVNTLNTLCAKSDLVVLKEFLESIFSNPGKHIKEYQTLQDPETLAKYQNWYAQIISILQLRDDMECKLDKMKEVTPISEETVRALVFNQLMQTNPKVLLPYMQEKDPEFTWRPEDLHVPQYLLGTVQRAMEKTESNKIAAGEEAMQRWFKNNQEKLSERFTPRIARRLSA